MGCTAEILCTPRCNPKPGSFRGLVNFSLRRTVAELRGIKVPNFRILAYFPHTKPVKRIFQWPAYRMIPIFPCGSWKSKGVPSGSGVFLQLLVWELGAPKLAQIFAYGKWLYPYRMQLHGASDLDQRCLKTRNSKYGCTFCGLKNAPKSYTPIIRDNMRAAAMLTFDKCLYLQGRLRLITARRLSVYM